MRDMKMAILTGSPSSGSSSSNTFCELPTSASRSPNERRAEVERKRLHILILPQQRVPSSMKHILNGKYSILKYPSHQKSQETIMKIRLIINNIVTISLCSWWQEFQHFDLVHLRDLSLNWKDMIRYLCHGNRLILKVSNSLSGKGFGLDETCLA